MKSAGNEYIKTLKIYETRTEYGVKGLEVREYDKSNEALTRRRSDVILENECRFRILEMLLGNLQLIVQRAGQGVTVNSEARPDSKISGSFVRAGKAINGKVGLSVQGGRKRKSRMLIS